MHILIFDTETTGLDKPFCYDVGYYIFDCENQTVKEQKHFVVEQIWHNLALFESAYYKEKRPMYIQLMRQHKAIMDKWGYIMRELKRDIRNYNATDAYAYNSSFDDKVFSFNCDWYKCNNPLDNIAIHDVWGYASEFITSTDGYKQFCETHQYFTDKGNYSSSAENVYRFITNNIEFSEMHMGLYDVDIETQILLYCINTYNAKWNYDYKVNRILPRYTPKPFTIKINGEVIFSDNYIKKTVQKDNYNFVTQGS